ncbi:EAL domain-containing protein, partial [Clostridium butyricum]|nr:EAL domain-containing protein [Clostridium butyricum]
QDVVPRIVFEITETAEIRDLGMLSGVLKMLGARIALDDFGVGFATMSMVKKHRPDFVKLSGYLVGAMAETGDTA